MNKLESSTAKSCDSLFFPGRISCAVPQMTPSRRATNKRREGMTNRALPEPFQNLAVGELDPTKSAPGLDGRIGRIAQIVSYPPP
jgi:hypothetical protein